MKKILLSILLLLSGATVFCTTWTITNSGYTFSPATITINLGDDVNFNLELIHFALEVSQSTWDADGINALPGGFQTSFGGGMVLSSKLGVGTHYYVCPPHVLALGMKGIIIVQNTTGISENQLPGDFTVYPNPSGNLMTIRTNNNLAGVQYFITDQSGRQVFKGKLDEDVTPVDIAKLTPGIYLIQIEGKRKQSFKVIKN